MLRCAATLLISAAVVDGFVLAPLSSAPHQQHASSHLQHAQQLSWQQPQSAHRRGARQITMAGSSADDPDHDEKVAKALKAMVGFSNSYCKNTDTRYCSDPSIPAVVIKGLAEHKVTLGAPLCPCRHYEDKEAEAKDGYWNCPCVPMRERHECHCMCAPAPSPRLWIPPTAAFSFLLLMQPSALSRLLPAGCF